MRTEELCRPFLSLTRELGLVVLLRQLLLSTIRRIICDAAVAAADANEQGEGYDKTYQPSKGNSP